jgi:hypothetical protein
VRLLSEVPHPPVLPHSLLALLALVLTLLTLQVTLEDLGAQSDYDCGGYEEVAEVVEMVEEEVVVVLECEEQQTSGKEVVYSLLEQLLKKVLVVASEERAEVETTWDVLGEDQVMLNAMQCAVQCAVQYTV